MSDAVALWLAGAAGALIGALFFGGLWWTVRKGPLSRHPALWFLGSLLFRTGICLVGFYYVSGGQADRLLACLLGFVIARFFVVRFTNTRDARLNVTDNEARHAS